MDATVPEIVLDYYFMGEESETAPHIVVKDTSRLSWIPRHRNIQLHVLRVQSKLGYKRILMKSDNEPAIKRLKERVSECLTGVECVPKEAPVGDSRANGSAENAVKQVKGQSTTLKTSTEDRYSCKIDAKSCLLAWIPRLCANLMTRFKRHTDGRTAIQRLTGRRWGRPMVVFGERILVKVAVSRAGRRAGLESAFTPARVCRSPWQVWGADGFDGPWSGKRPQFQEITRDRSFRRLRAGKVEGITLESEWFFGG